MVDFKIIKAPKIVKVKDDNEGSTFRLEQSVSVGDVSVVVKHNCLAFNNGSVAVNDFNTETLNSLNEEAEQQLVSYLQDEGEAFEVIESLSMDVDDIFNQYMK